MKKLFFIFLSILTFTGYSQSDSCLSIYGSIGISVGNINPNDPMLNSPEKVSYPSLEIGITKQSVNVGAIVGLTDFRLNTPILYYELKASLSIPVKECYIYPLFGVGAYAEKKFVHFIEYGGGFSYMPKKIGYYVQYSNWANSNYISLGITYLIK